MTTRSDTPTLGSALACRYAVLIAAPVFLAGFMLAMHLKGYRLWIFPTGGSLSALLAVLAAILALYNGALLVLSSRFRRMPGRGNDMVMLMPVLRLVAMLFAFAAACHIAGVHPASWTALAGFGGLLLGWSLQAPVSGLAAWLLISTKRPFRVGDRVKLQAWDLRGDITHIGMMYTELNQVGGTVGSEDLAGRTILVPNAMLFQNIVVNYTPRQASAFVLDEVTVRTTYNSDWTIAERILLQAAAEVTGDIVQRTGVQPYIRAQMYDYGVQFYLRYMTPATDRPRVVYELTKRIVAAFARSPDVDFALPFVFSQRTGMQMTTQRRNQGDPPFMARGLPADKIAGSTPDDGSQEVAELAESIARHGLLQPVIVHEDAPGNYTVVAGKLRLAACRQLGWSHIPCVLSDAMPPPDDPTQVADSFGSHSGDHAIAPSSGALQPC